ncbi:hypothetical protein A0H81_00893 [Grifola frondosa]|uniref:Ribosome biogenesis protein SLX9 n=1 Tax=Grifola frondosa TaxID=5627 RepID=A0A1C7MU76_GRIFR|nr:hypothetical protein A0H81_00893 [Grifola frondosa]
MPKDTRRRTGGHEQSIRLSKRQFAVQDNTVEHVNVGEQTSVTGPEILASMAEQEEPRTAMKKKEKQALKHDLFVKRLESARSPYSKSHERRLKRKARNKLPVELQNAINLDDEVTNETPKAKPKPGQIGEGKGVPLSKAQRKRALQVERMRVPMILSNPEFTLNPFQTIRTHAQNTLLKHQPPA